VETRDLVPAVLEREVRLQRAEADAVHGLQRLAKRIQRLAFLDADALGNQFVHFAHVI